MGLTGRPGSDPRESGQSDKLYFLGKPIDYWYELDKQAQTLSLDKLIREMGDLRAKVSFYESRVIEMKNFMDVLNK